MSAHPKDKYHPGTCSATEFGKRYGKNLIPQTYDDPKHLWHLAKSKNWGNWTCCGGAASSPPCQFRPPDIEPSKKKIGVGSYIQFLINTKDKCLVVGEESNAWILDSGRIAKKSTQHKSWVWCDSGKMEGDNIRGVGGFIKFLVNNKDTCLVVADEEKVWRLDSGRIAKKATHGKSWVWIQDL